MTDDADGTEVDGTEVDESAAGSQGVSKKPKKGRKSRDRLKADLSAAAETNRRLKLGFISAVIAALLLAGGTVGFAVAYQSTHSQLSQEQDSSASRHSALEGARKAAEDYTTRALTIDYQKSTEFVEGLARGTTEAFGKTFSLGPNGAGALTKELLDQLHMTSEGEVVYAFLDGDSTVDRKRGEPWNFVVAARQTSTTVQQPERTTTAVILRVVVVDVNGEWRIANFAPDPKVQGGDTGLVPGAK